MDKCDGHPVKRKKSSKKSKSKKKRRSSDEDYKRKMVKKLHSYFMDDRLDKLIKLYTKFEEMDCPGLFIDHINKVYGSRQWTYLHEFCSRGETTVVDFILTHGGKTDVLDNRANNFLHYALNYVIESFDRNFLYYIVGVLYTLPEELLTQRNNYGETATDLLEEITELLQNREKRFLEPDSESESEFVDEKSWNERLFMEMGEDEGGCYRSEMFSQEEFEDTYRKRKRENFQEWGDRMWKDHHLKHSKIQNEPHKNEKKIHEEKRKVKLGPAKTLKELRMNLEIIQNREKYEEACFNLFKNSEEKKLTMMDIPWTHFPGYTSDNLNIENCLNGMVKMFSHGFTPEDKIKYFKVQRIRWHPDKFLQKCGHRLSDKDRDKILDLVKTVSQKINSEIDSLVSVENS